MGGRKPAAGSELECPESRPLCCCCYPLLDLRPAQAHQRPAAACSLPARGRQATQSVDPTRTANMVACNGGGGKQCMCWTTPACLEGGVDLQISMASDHQIQ